MRLLTPADPEHHVRHHRRIEELEARVLGDDDFSVTWICSKVEE